MGRAMWVWMLLLVAAMGVASGQFDPQAKKFPPKHQDIPFIKCGVCKVAAREVVQRVEAMREEGTELDDEALLKVADNLCDPDTTSGKWGNFVELVENADGRVEVLMREEEGECRVACRTAARACADVVDGVESDVADLLWKPGVPVEKVEKMMCSGACKKGDAVVPSDRRGDREEFVVKHPDRVALDSQMRDMKEVGGAQMPGMTMYDRNDIDTLGDDGGYDDDDDLDDIAVPAASDEKPSSPSSPSSIIDDATATLTSAFESAKSAAASATAKVASTVSDVYDRLARGNEEL